MKRTGVCPYSKQNLKRYLWWMVLFWGLNRVTGGNGFALYLALLFIPLAKKRTVDSIFWVMLGVVSLSAGTFFVPKGGVFSIAHRASFVLLGGIGLMRVLGTRKTSVVCALMGVFLYLLYMIIPSANGWWPKISLLKIFLFATVYCTLADMANDACLIRMFDLSRLRSAYLCFAIFFILGSVAVIPFPAISMMNAKELLYSSDAASLFKGTSNHSQWLGPVVTGFSLLVFGDWLWSIQRWDLLYGALFFCSPLLIYKTSSRTAMGAFVIGLAFLLLCFFQANRISSRWRQKVISIGVCVIAIGGIALVATPGGRDRFAKFALKRGADRDAKSLSIERIVSSRKGLMDRSMENFRKKPAIGNGFQVTEEMQGLARHATGMILSAPIEKGVWVTAMLEEGGIIGFLLYVLFMGVSFVIMLSRRCYITAGIFFTMHVSNLGEFSLFSMSGCGGIWWTMVFIAVVLDEQRNRNGNAVPWHPYPQPYSHC